MTRAAQAQAQKARQDELRGDRRRARLRGAVAALAVPRRSRLRQQLQNPGYFWHGESSVGWANLFEGGSSAISDSTVGMFVVLVLFFVPTKKAIKGEPIDNPDDCADLPPT